jgi:hypothetical protein
MNLMSWKYLLYQDAFCPKLFDDVQPIHEHQVSAHQNSQ